MITRDNYEIWFLDAADGTLDKGQLEMLRAFLLANPDLEEEFNAFDPVSLHPSDDILLDKGSLLKEENVGFVNRENLDDYLIAQLEDDLTHKEAKELEVFMESHPEFDLLQTSYQHTRLPESNEQFGDLSPLLKRRRTPVYRIGLYSGMAAAAAALLFILFTPNETSKRAYSQRVKEGPKTQTLPDPIEQNPVQVEEQAPTDQLALNANRTDDVQNDAQISTPNTSNRTAPDSDSTVSAPQIREYQPLEPLPAGLVSRELREPAHLVTELQPLHIDTEEVMASTPSAPDHFLEIAADKLHESTGLDVDFDHEKDEEKVSYSFRLGKFQFSRTRNRD